MLAASRIQMKGAGGAGCTQMTVVVVDGCNWMKVVVVVDCNQMKVVVEVGYNQMKEAWGACCC